jgi:hypothetical protein
MCGTVRRLISRTLYARINSVIEDRRQFVRTDTYFGPDRRVAKGLHVGPDRREKESAAQPESDFWDIESEAAA